MIVKFLRSFVPFLLLCVSAYAGAQTVTLKFPDTSSRKIWIAPSLGDQLPDKFTETTQNTQPLDLKSSTDTDRVYVLNTVTGNIASEPVGQIKEDSTWVVGPEAETLIGVVKLKIEHEGKAVAAGQVKAVTGGRTISKLLSPSSKGEITLLGVSPGKLEVSVTYASGSATKTTTPQTWEMALKRTDPAPVMALTIPDQVDVVEAGSTPAAQPASSSPAPAKKEEPAEGWGFGRFFIYVMALAVGVAVFVLGMKLLKQNETLVKQKIGDLGIKIPDDQATIADDAPMPPMPKAPEPVQPIILGDATPDPVAMAPIPTMPSAVVTAVANPRLVSGAGDLILIPEGNSVVGRETTVDHPMPSEASLSRRHAEFVRTGDTVAVRDLGSTNKTYVNGQPIGDSPVTLYPGDRVQFGVAQFHFEA